MEIEDCDAFGGATVSHERHPGVSLEACGSELPAKLQAKQRKELRAVQHREIEQGCPQQRVTLDCVRDRSGQLGGVHESCVEGERA